MLRNAPMVIWLTGLPCSGKTTLAIKLLQRYRQLGIKTCHLDGDKVRQTINSDLSFTADSRKENLRRVAHMINYLLFEAEQEIILCSFVSPLREDRLMVKDMVIPANFIEVFIDCSLVICESRDVKGMYQEARNGSKLHFTGIDAGYERPAEPNIHIFTSFDPVETSYVNLRNELTKYIL